MESLSLFTFCAPFFKQFFTQNNPPPCTYIKIKKILVLIFFSSRAWKLQLQFETSCVHNFSSSARLCKSSASKQNHGLVTFFGWIRILKKIILNFLAPEQFQFRCFIYDYFFHQFVSIHIHSTKRNTLFYRVLYISILFLSRVASGSGQSELGSANQIHHTYTRKQASFCSFSKSCSSRLETLCILYISPNITLIIFSLFYFYVI